MGQGPSTSSAQPRLAPLRTNTWTFERTCKLHAKLKLVLGPSTECRVLVHRSLGDSAEAATARALALDGACVGAGAKRRALGQGAGIAAVADAVVRLRARLKTPHSVNLTVVHWADEVTGAAHDTVVGAQALRALVHLGKAAETSLLAGSAATATAFDDYTVAPSDDECPCCLSNRVDMVLPCAHGCCRECHEEWSRTAGSDATSCPLCRLEGADGEAWTLDTFDQTDLAADQREVAAKVREVLRTRAVRAHLADYYEVEADLEAEAGDERRRRVGVDL